MNERGAAGLKTLVFAVVTAAFTTIYITQPVLPVIAGQFGVDEARASLTVSAVVLGIALANLPFGALADRYRVKPIVAFGGAVVALFGLASAFAPTLPLLVAARFAQGLCIPALTTCLVVHLARALPPERLGEAMGAYVSATVAGGLGGRLLGGFALGAEKWRWAFVIGAGLVAASSFAAARLLPPAPPRSAAERRGGGFLPLLRRWATLRLFLVGFGAFFVFSSVFTYLPFRLSGPPFAMGTRAITLLYLSYLVGVLIGPVAGRAVDRHGAGPTLAGGAAIFVVAVLLTLAPSLPLVALALALVCAGFFSVHAAAVAALNRRLAAARGKANALYTLFYYLGGAAGITASGHAYKAAAWRGVAALALAALALLFAAGIVETRAARADEIR